MFGPNFERYEEVQAAAAIAEADTEAPEEEKVGGTQEKDKFKSKKGKLVAKSTGLTYQFQILESIGISHTEINKFTDPLHWLAYFPPIAMVS